jgi:hypothetical protein
MINIIKVLLEQRIFESELKAKIAFPKLFRLSPIRNIQRTASENNTARSEVEALKKIASLKNKNDEKNKKYQIENSKNNINLIRNLH